MKIISRALLAVFSGIFIAQGADFKVLTRYAVPGTGGFDYATVDSATHRLYLSHGTQVDVVDTETGKQVGTIPDTPGVHGIAIATQFQHGFTSNGRENRVSMFDPATLNLIKKIDVGKGPDGIYYDPATKRVFTNNHGSHDITAIDASSGAVVGTVKVNGDGEEAVIGADGLIYVNSENTNEVIVFDPKSLEVKKRFPIGIAEIPTGLAYDAKTNRLFIGCRREPKMVVMDASNGKVVGSYPIGVGVDYGAFDPDSQLVFFSCNDGTLSIYHEKSADVYEEAGSVKTQPSAKTMALDPATKRIYLPAAEYTETPGRDPSSRPTRSIKPDSFVVIVVGQ